MLIKGLRHHMFRHRESGDLLFIMEANETLVSGAMVTRHAIAINANAIYGKRPDRSGWRSPGPDLWKPGAVSLSTLVKEWEDMGPGFREERNPVVGFAVTHGPNCDCFGGKPESTPVDRRMVN